MLGICFRFSVSYLSFVSKCIVEFSFICTNHLVNYISEFICDVAYILASIWLSPSYSCTDMSSMSRVIGTVKDVFLRFI